MDLASPHFGFVLAAYVLSAAVLAGLLIWTLMRKRSLEEEAKRVLKAED
jgi:heme exporter protein CcmD